MHFLDRYSTGKNHFYKLRFGTVDDYLRFWGSLGTLRATIFSRSGEEIHYNPKCVEINRDWIKKTVPYSVFVSFQDEEPYIYLDVSLKRISSRPEICGNITVSEVLRCFKEINANGRRDSTEAEAH